MRGDMWFVDRHDGHARIHVFDKEKMLGRIISRVSRRSNSIALRSLQCRTLSSTTPSAAEAAVVRRLDGVMMWELV